MCTQETSFYIEQLVTPTKTMNSMLIDCWDRLSISEQINIINRIDMDQGSPSFYGHLHIEQLTVCIMQSSCVLVKSVFINKAQQSSMRLTEIMKNAIVIDKSHIVKAFAEEDAFHLDHCVFSEESICQFFLFRHEKRLAIVRNAVFGESIAKILSYAISNDSIHVPVHELADIASEYLLSEKFKAWRDDYWLATEGDTTFFADGLTKLWELVPSAPFPLARILVQYLPPFYGFCDRDNVLFSTKIDKELVKLYLYRKDVFNNSARHHFFLNSDDVFLRLAASSHNLELDFDEFGKVLSSPEDDKIDMLQGLAYNTHAQPLAIANALFDLLSADYKLKNEAERARILFNDRLESISLSSYDEEVKHLRIYRMAHLIAVNTRGLDNSDIEPSLRRITVYGDAWATFMNYFRLFHPTFDFVSFCPGASKLMQYPGFFARKPLPAEILSAFLVKQQL